MNKDKMSKLTQQRHNDVCIDTLFKTMLCLNFKQFDVNSEISWVKYDHLNYQIET